MRFSAYRFRASTLDVGASVCRFLILSSRRRRLKREDPRAGGSTWHPVGLPLPLGAQLFIPRFELLPTGVDAAPVPKFEQLSSVGKTACLTQLGDL
jgi:hypothetical protein